jgi:hypothetical protein
VIPPARPRGHDLPDKPHRYPYPQHDGSVTSRIRRLSEFADRTSNPDLAAIARKVAVRLMRDER